MTAPQVKATRSRALNRLTNRKVETAEAGAHPDGGGLYLRVSAKGARKWELRYKSPLSGKRVDMGLGRADKGHVTLATARELAAAARDKVARGLDPVAERDREKAQQAARSTFGQFAEDWMQAKLDEFRNEKHRAQWRSTLRTYCAPLWTMPLDAITTADVRAVLDPIWKKKPETAKRVQNRIEQLLDAAKAEGKRSGDNPARWRGHLAKVLPKRTKLSRGHHAALPYDHAPEVLAAMRKRGGVAARALEFLILAAARSGEVRGMVWGELDRERQVWTVPAQRTKVGEPHRVPLTDRAREILAEMENLRPDERSPRDLVFPGARKGSQLSDMTLSAVIKRMHSEAELGALLQDLEGRTITVHGFRSTFRDWAEDVARFPARVAEAALSHQIKNNAEAAYRRGDAFELRCELMKAWESYLGGGTGLGSNVIAMRA